MKYVIVAFAAISLSSAAPLQMDINQIQQQLQQMFPQLQFPTSGGFQAEISLPPFLQSNITVEEDELFFSRGSDLTTTNVCQLVSYSNGKTIYKSIIL